VVNKYFINYILYKEKEMSLTSIKQFELATVKYSINLLESDINLTKNMIAGLYRDSVPESPTGKAAFVRLNQMRDVYRLQKAHIKKLAMVAKVLKTEIRGVNEHKPRDRGTRYPKSKRV
jgi:hypothetical protein